MLLPIKQFIKKTDIKNSKQGKVAKIATVNLKMGNYNSGKFKGTKPYTVN